MSKETLTPFRLVESIKEDLHFIILQIEFATCTRGDDDNITTEDLENIHRVAKRDIYRVIKTRILKKLNMLSDIKKGKG